MMVNTSQSFRTVLTGFPNPPKGFVNISKDTPGMYVFSETTFEPSKSIQIRSWDRKRISSDFGDDTVVGIITILLIAIITECVLMSCESSIRYVCSQFDQIFKQACEEFPKQCAKEFVKDVDCLRSFNLHLFVKRRFKEDGKELPIQWRRRLGIAAVVVVILMWGLDVAVIYFLQSQKYPNGKLEYNLKGSHPVGTNLGLGRFVRRNFQERPCITPVFYNSNPVRNFSISTCHSLNLREAHKEVEDSVSSVTIGSWFHKAGSDHRILFGNASIRIGARAFVYGTQNGTYRILFPKLTDNYMSVTHYLHQLVIYKILTDTCHDEHSAKSCEELFTEHRIEANVVTEKIRLWLPKNKKFVRFALVQGLETTLRARIHKPWPTVFQSVGPLLTTELIEEVQGRGLYSHISSEESKEDIPGLLYLEAKRCGLPVWSILFLISGMSLFGLKLCRNSKDDEHNLSEKGSETSPEGDSAEDHSPSKQLNHETSPFSQCTKNSSDSEGRAR